MPLKIEKILKLPNIPIIFQLIRNTKNHLWLFVKKKHIWNMKKTFWFLLFLGALSAFAKADSLETLKNIELKEPTLNSIPTEIQTIPSRELRPKLPGLVPFLEIIGQNVLVWGWDYFILEKDYAKISLDVWERNLNEGWTWDDNHWAINFFGHPYQGSFYHVAARSSGFDFYPSLLFSAFGSWTWEYFAEQEYPSFNDFVVTSVGGSLYGEMLFRLSQRLLTKPDPTWFEQGQSFILHPLSFLHWKVAGPRSNNPGYFPIAYSLALGGGYRFGSDYRYDKMPAERLDDDWEEINASATFMLTYGYPDRKIKKPVDYFTVYARYEYGQENQLFAMNTSAKLLNYSQSNYKDSWFDIGMYLNFDSYYGDLAKMGNLSLGIGLDLNIPLTQNIQMRYKAEPGFIFLGSADFNYDELLEEIIPNYEVTREYQYNYGARYFTSIHFKFFEKINVNDRFNINLMKTMPNSEPHYGAHGYDIIGTNELFAEYLFTKNVALGIRLDSYFKIAAYTGEYFEPMSRTFHSVGFYNRLKF